MRTMSDIIGAIVATLSHMVVLHKFPNQTGESFQFSSQQSRSCGPQRWSHGQRTQGHIVWTKSVRKGINCRLKLKGIRVSSVHQ
jgi:hypothetical protein